MAYQAETAADWPANVYQVAVSDPVLGGVDGPVNILALALAKRSLYQRMRNVTAWDAVLAAAFGYVAGACVRHGTTTWRAVVDNNVAPGTDVTKWERWGWSEKELAAYLRGSLLSPVACPVTGPVANPSDASPYTMWKSVAPYAEYWMWMGDAWKVVANRYTTYVGGASTARVANVTSVICSVAVPRAGKVYARGILSQQNQTNSYTYLSSYIKQYRGGPALGIVLNSLAKDVTTLGTEYSQVRSIAVVDVLAGDILALEGVASQNMFAASTSDSSIHVEYLQ